MQPFIPNPFQFEGIVTGDKFCDRKDAIAELLGYIYNSSNVIISMKRRVGKSSLIKEVFENHADKQQVICAYVDIYGITSTKELFTELKDEVEKILSITAKIVNFQESVKAAFADANILMEISKTPKISIEFSERNYAVAIKKLLLSLQNFAAHEKLKIAFAIDEFQKITKLEKEEMEKIETNMRTAMQDCKNISFVLSGSNQTMLDKMFEENRPLYRQGMHQYLSPIDKEVFYKWTSLKLQRKEIVISKEAFDYLYELSCGEAKIVQQACFILFNKTKSLTQITLESICDTIEFMYKNNSEISTKFNSFKLNEQRMLKIIAFEKGSGVTVSPYLQEYNVNHGSVSNILKGMVEKYIIKKNEAGQYEIVDTELKLWILVKHKMLCLNDTP